MLAHVVSHPEMLDLLLTAYHCLPSASLTNLVRADPLSLDGPASSALMSRIVAGVVTMPDQAASGMSALKVDDLKLSMLVS